MPRKTAKQSETPEKKTTRSKKAAEPVAEAPVETVDTAADTPVKKTRGRKPRTAADAAAAATPVKKTRGRKPKEAAAAADTPVKKTRGRKAKAETPAEAPVKKTRGRKKTTPEIVAETLPPVEAETAVEDASVNIQPDMVVDLPESVAEEPVVAELLPDQLANDAAESAAETPVKKTRKPRTKKTDKKAADAAPKKRGRKPKETGPVLITTLQIGEAEFDISALAEKAYKEYKRVHKRKVVTDFHIYVKPEEGAAYYTVNGEGSEEFKIDLT